MPTHTHTLDSECCTSSTLLPQAIANSILRRPSSVAALASVSCPVSSLQAAMPDKAAGRHVGCCGKAIADSILRRPSSAAAALGWC